MSKDIVVFKDIPALLQGLKTLQPKNKNFHIHRFEDTPETQVNETAIFRSNTYALILMLEGEADYKIGLHEYHMCPGSLYFLGPRHLRHYKRDNNNWKGFVCLFTDEFTTSTNLPNHFNDYAFYSLRGKQKFQLENEELNTFKNQMTHLYEMYETNEMENCWHYLHIILNNAEKLHRLRYEQQEEKPEDELVINFNRVLEQHFYDLVTNKAESLYSVQDFADKLFVHPNYLSATLKKSTGLTAGKLIKNRTVLEAKSMLQSTDMTISEIAYTLKFNDTSYFTKFFKGATGQTPTQFKEVK